MGRTFKAHGENMTLGTGSVLLVLQTAASPNAASFLKILRVEVTQSASAISAMPRLVFSTRDTSGTLTTTSVTPTNDVLGGPTSGLSGNTSVIGAVARIGINSSADSGGTYTNHWPNASNQLNGYYWVPTPSEIIWVPPSTVWCVRFAAAPTSTTGWDVAVAFEEVV